MARVVFPDHLLSVSGGVRELNVAAANVRDLLIELEALFPGSEDTLAKSAIAIDGQIHQDAYLEPIGPDSEVFFMLRLEGG